MATSGEKFRALLTTGRAANLPTVWSNVLVAFGLAWAWSARDLHDKSANFVDFTSLGLATLSATLLYLGGCLLGDCLDLEFDRKNKPHRPLPTGQLKLRHTIILAIACLITGIIIGVSLTFFTLVLASLIVSYAYFHKKSRVWPLANMGLCRTALILFSVCIVTNHWTHPIFIVTAFTIGLYTMGLSAVAATESDTQPFAPRKVLRVGMLALPLPLMGILILKNQGAFYQTNGLMTLTVGVYLAWMIYSFSILQHSKPVFVSRALAGFCLLDACIAATFSLPLTLICLGLFTLALLLQKITPAT